MFVEFKFEFDKFTGSPRNNIYVKKIFELNITECIGPK